MQMEHAIFRNLQGVGVNPNQIKEEIPYSPVEISHRP